MAAKCASDKQGVDIDPFAIEKCNHNDRSQVILQCYAAISTLRADGTRSPSRAMSPSVKGDVGCAHRHTPSMAPSTAPIERQIRFSAGGRHPRLLPPSHG